MTIRRAERWDLERINDLLKQVLDVHYKARPDVFKKNAKKYTDEQILSILDDESRPIFVAVEKGLVVGYAFCVFVTHKQNLILTDIKTLYIDDLCVDEKFRGKKIGKSLYDFVLEYAKNEGCYNVTLNVWADNENAVKFYEKMGLKTQKIMLEKIL